MFLRLKEILCLVIYRENSIYEINLNTSWIFNTTIFNTFIFFSTDLYKSLFQLIYSH